MELDLDGRMAWITGAAGAIGSAISIALARHDVHAILTSRREETLVDTAAEISCSGGPTALVSPADLTNRGQVDHAAARILQERGRIEILVNSITMAIFGAFLKLTDEEWQTVIETKYLGYVRTMRAVLPYMVVLYLVSDRSAFVTGALLPVDGGRMPTV